MSIYTYFPLSSVFLSRTDPPGDRLGGTVGKARAGGTSYLLAMGSMLLPDGINLPDMEKQLILNALEQTKHNKSKTSKLLGLSRTQLRTRMKKHGLDPG